MDSGRLPHGVGVLYVVVYCQQQLQDAAPLLAAPAAVVQELQCLFQSMVLQQQQQQQQQQEQPSSSTAAEAGSAGVALTPAAQQVLQLEQVRCQAGCAVGIDHASIQCAGMDEQH